MASGKLTFRFTSSLVKPDQGIVHHILPVPAAIAAAWKKARVRRLSGTINGEPINRALMRHAGGGSFLIVSRDFIKQAGIGFSVPARLAFGPDPKPDAPDMPEEFRLALDQDDAARERWETFPPGRRRSLLVTITGARTEPTRIKRSLELARKIRNHTLYGDRRVNHPPRPA